MDTIQADEIERIVDERMARFLVKFSKTFEGYHTPRADDILAIIEELRYERAKERNKVDYKRAKERNKVDYSGFDPILDWDGHEKEFNFQRVSRKADPRDLTQVNPHILGGMVTQISEDHLVLDDELVTTEDTSTPREYSETALRVQELAGKNDGDWLHQHTFE